MNLARSVSDISTRLPEGGAGLTDLKRSTNSRVLELVEGEDIEVRTTVIDPSNPGPAA